MLNYVYRAFPQKSWEKEAAAYGLKAWQRRLDYIAGTYEQAYGIYNTGDPSNMKYAITKIKNADNDINVPAEWKKKSVFRKLR